MKNILIYTSGEKNVVLIKIFSIYTFGEKNVVLIKICSIGIFLLTYELILCLI